MEIVFNGKRHNASEFFENFDAFFYFLKDRTSKINFKNGKIVENIKHAYESIIEEKGTLYLSKSKNEKFITWLNKKFKFKEKNNCSLNFWIERGWSKETSKNKADFLNDKISKKVQSTKKENVKKIKSKGVEETGKPLEFLFKSKIFFLEEEPVCNLCKSKFVIKKVFKNNKFYEFYYKIIKCSNINCKTHKLKRTTIYESILPEEIGKKIQNIENKSLKKRNHYCVEYWIEKGFSKEEGMKKISEIQLANSKKVKNRFFYTKETLKEKFKLTEEEIDIFYSEKSIWSISYWVKKGYNIDDAKIKIKQIQSKNANKVDYKKRLTTTQLQYWINKGYKTEEAKKKLKERQSTFNLKKCINKHGYEKGVEIYNERQEKWQKTLTKNGNAKSGFSKISQKLFYEILNFYKIEDRKNIYFKTKNHEISFKSEIGGVFLYDFSDLKNKKIIEFNGDIFHGNPKFFNENHICNPYRKDLTAKEKWKQDEEKKQIAIKNGFDIFVVWEYDYKKNKEKTIEECKMFLNLL